MAYHINIHGSPALCKAKTPESCRAKRMLPNQHFSTKDEAASAFEKAQNPFYQELTPSFVHKHDFSGFLDNQEIDALARKFSPIVEKIDERRVAENEGYYELAAFADATNLVEFEGKPAYSFYFDKSRGHSCGMGNIECGACLRECIDELPHLLSKIDSLSDTIALFESRMSKEEFDKTKKKIELYGQQVELRTQKLYAVNGAPWNGNAPVKDLKRLTQQKLNLIKTNRSDQAKIDKIEASIRVFEESQKSLIRGRGYEAVRKLASKEKKQELDDTVSVVKLLQEQRDTLNSLRVLGDMFSAAHESDLNGVFEATKSKHEDDPIYQKAINAEYAKVKGITESIIDNAKFNVLSLNTRIEERNDTIKKIREKQWGLGWPARLGRLPEMPDDYLQVQAFGTI